MERTQVELECTPASIIERQNNLAGGYSTLFILGCPLCNDKAIAPGEDKNEYIRSRSLEIHHRILSLEGVESISLKESGYKDNKYAYLEETIVGLHPVDSNITLQVRDRA